MIDHVAVNTNEIIISFTLQKQILDQLHSNHIGIEKTLFLLRESVLWINMNVDIECTVKQCTACLEYQWMHSQEKLALWNTMQTMEVVAVDVFLMNGKNLLCIVDYQSKFQIVKKVNSLSAEDLVQTAKLIFAEYGLPKKIILDTGTNFMAETYKNFSRRMNIQQTITSSYYHQSNSQIKACIKFVKHTNGNALTLIETYI